MILRHQLGELVGVMLVDAVHEIEHRCRGIHRPPPKVRETHVQNGLPRSTMPPIVFPCPQLSTRNKETADAKRDFGDRPGLDSGDRRAPWSDSQDSTGGC